MSRDPFEKAIDAAQDNLDDVIAELGKDERGFKLTRKLEELWEFLERLKEQSQDED